MVQPHSFLLRSKQGQFLLNRDSWQVCLWPHFCWGHMCDSTQGLLYPNPMKICQSMRIQWPSFKKKPWTKGHWSLDDLWPQVCWGHMCDSTPELLCSKSHENTSQCVDTVTLFSKTWTKGHWFLDDLWPNVCWGHKCDSTQGSMCPSYVQNEWSYSDSLFLNKV